MLADARSSESLEVGDVLRFNPFPACHRILLGEVEIHDKLLSGLQWNTLSDNSACGCLINRLTQIGSVFSTDVRRGRAFYPPHVSHKRTSAIASNDD